MKLLIVEDEKRPREGLYNLIVREFHGIDLLSPSCNGAEGLETICNERPDIIISDIKMPGLDGLEMISAIEQEGYSPYIIIVSGHSDFEYARTSLKLGVRDYILKPFVKEDIINTIAKAISDAGSCEDLSARVSGDCEGSTDPGYYLVIKYKGRKNGKKLFAYIRSLLVRSIGSDYSVSEYSDPKLNRMVFHLKARPAGTSVSSLLCSQMFSKIMLTSHGKLTGVWFDETKQTRPVRELWTALDHHLFYEWENSIVDSTLTAQETMLESERYKQIERELMILLERRDITGAEEQFRKWLNHLTEQRSAPSVLKEKQRALLFSVLSHVKKMFPQSFHNDMVQEYSTGVSECLNRTDLEALMTKAFNLFAPQEERLHTGGILISKILSYIDSHIHEPINLEETAFLFNVSSEHLSRLFKEETTVGFNHYVNKAKIDIAKNQLLGKAKRINTISEELGFSSPQYFGKVFKRYTSYTPKEYRERFL